MSQVLSSGWDQLPGNQRILDAIFEFQEWGALFEKHHESALLDAPMVDKTW